MTRQFRLIASLCVCTLLTACYYPYPGPYATTTVPASFDRSWDAALGAAADSGIQVSSADQASGRITGSKAGASVVILLLRQSDGSLQVSFTAPDSRETNPSLADRWSASYNRRMGR